MRRLLPLTLLILLPTPAAAQGKDALGDPLPPEALARLGTARLQHATSVSSLAFLDNKTLVSCGGDRRISCWDVATGKLRTDLFANETEVSQVALSADGSTLAAAFGNPTRFRILDAATGKERFAWKAPAGAFRLALSPDGKLLAAAFQGVSVHVWDTTTGQVVKQFDGVKGSAETMAFSPDGKLFACGGYQRGLEVWEVESGKLRHVLKGDAKDNVISLTFAADGKALLVGTTEAVQAWDPDTGKPVRRFATAKNWPRSMSGSQDGKLLALPTNDAGSIALLDPSTGNELRRCSGGHANGVTLVALSPDGKTLASTGFGDSYICLWDTATGKALHSRPGHQAAVQYLAVSPDGKRLLTGSGDRTARLWDLTTNKEIRSFSFGIHAAGAVAFAPDGKVLACGGGAASSDNVVKLFDADSGMELRTLGKKLLAVKSLAFSPDGKRLAAAAAMDKILVWDAANGAEQPPLVHPGQSAVTVAFRPDGKLVSGHFDGTMRLWNVDASVEANSVAVTSRSSHTLTLSADGGAVLTGGADKTTRLFDPLSGKLLRACEGPPTQAFAVALSPDGRWVAAAGGDAKVYLFEASTGKPVAAAPGHASFVFALKFSPDGKRLYSGSGDTTVLVWEVRKLLGRTAVAARKLDADQLVKRWDDLGGMDAVRGNDAVRALAGSPKEAVALLAERLKAPAALKDLARHIADLGFDNVTIRDQAEGVLADLGGLAEAELRKALAANPPAEVRQRIEALLKRLETGPGTYDGRRAVRVVDLLEDIGTAEARQLLERLAKDYDSVRLGREARAALKRLAE